MFTSSRMQAYFSVVDSGRGSHSLSPKTVSPGKGIRSSSFTVVSFSVSLPMSPILTCLWSFAVSNCLGSFIVYSVFSLSSGSAAGLKVAISAQVFLPGIAMWEADQVGS